MKGYLKKTLFLGPLLLIFTASFNQNREGEKGEVLHTTQAYTDAYNRSDSTALSQFWLEDAVYVNPITGYSLQGRDAIADEFKKIFDKFKNARLETTVDSVEFPNRDTAVEFGSTKLTVPGQPLYESRFIAIFEKKNGRWLLKKVSEAELFAKRKEFQHLKELHWLIGNWKEESEGLEVKSNARWALNKQFIIMNFSLNMLGSTELEGKQIIGWDPVQQQIVSWVFDSDGGHGQGKWKKEGNRWIIENSYIFGNGNRGSSVNIYALYPNDEIIWESTGREIEGEILPNIGPVNVQRKKG